MVIPSLTVLKLYIGVGKVASTREERQTVEAVLDSYPLVNMTPSISRRAGQLLGERMAETDNCEGPRLGKEMLRSLQPLWNSMSLSSLAIFTSRTPSASPMKTTGDSFLILEDVSELVLL